MRFSDTKDKIWISNYRWWGLGSEQTLGYYDKKSNQLVIFPENIRAILKITRAITKKYSLKLSPKNIILENI
jgi:hypothetical protein